MKVICHLPRTQIQSESVFVGDHQMSFHHRDRDALSIVDLDVTHRLSTLRIVSVCPVRIVILVIVLGVVRVKLGLIWPRVRILLLLLLLVLLLIVLLLIVLVVVVLVVVVFVVVVLLLLLLIDVVLLLLLLLLLLLQLDLDPLLLLVVGDLLLIVGDIHRPYGGLNIGARHPVVCGWKDI